MRRRTILAAAAAVPILSGIPAQAASSTGTVHEGEIDGARFRIEIPPGWNGTLLLWCRAPVYTAGPGQPIETASDPYAGKWLLDHGYALAATNYRLPSSASFGSAMVDQAALLAWIEAHLLRPQRTIAWGVSGGGLLSVLLAERHPGRISGALPLCGILAGLDGVLRLGLDFATAMTSLLGAEDIPLVNITDPDGVSARVYALIDTATTTASGRARLAMASALTGVPGWFHALRPLPPALDDRIEAMAGYARWGGAWFWSGLRADLEGQVGGNPTGNVGVDYHRQFVRSSQATLTRQAYQAAGLSVEADLARLARAPRVQADRQAALRLARLTPTGDLEVPVLALHSTGDGMAVPEHESAYTPRLKRAVYTARGGHGCFTAAEVITGLRVLEQRITGGRWPELSPAALNRQASGLDGEVQVAQDWGGDFQFKPAAPAFVAHHPKPFPR